MKNHQPLRMAALFLALVMLLVACAPAAPTASEMPETAAQESESVVDTSSEESETSDVPQEGSQKLRVAALKGPTAMGLAKLFSDNEVSQQYETSLFGAPDQIVPEIVKGSVDIAAVPSNVASVLYNKTQGEIQVLNVNTLGTLYLVSKDQSVQEISDLKGHTLSASGKGAAPEYILRYLLEENGLSYQDDVTVNWQSEHAAVVQEISQYDTTIGLLPEPFVTTAIQKAEAHPLIDLTQAWEETPGTGDSALVMGVLVARREVVEERKAEVDAFLKQAADSVATVNADTEAGAEWIGALDIVPEEIAREAIGRSNLVSIEGEEMKQMLSGYLQVLFDQNPEAVGGVLPADDFYYMSTAH